uniref:Cysteine proteinase inhibitor n=1 Tax=Solanum tuberosum TaxID=4113 RepID=M1A5P8_SOLTU
MAIVGGLVDVPFENKVEFDDLARFAVQDYNQKNDSSLEFKKVLNVKQQIVAGIMYYITFEATEGGNKKEYEAKILLRKWEDLKKVVGFKLVGDDSTMPGGIVNVPNPNNTKFQELARFAIQDYNKKQNAHLEFVENLNVKEQVVAGIMYYITLAATDDAGKKKIYKKVLNVKQQIVAGIMYYITLAAIDAGKKKIYEAKIWVKEWEDFKKVVEFKLVGDDIAKLGGITDVPFPNNPEFQDLARFAIQVYNKKENVHLEFVENLNVKQQVVAGMMYYITLAAIDAGKKKIYETKIWVKEWEDFKKVVEFKLVGDDSTMPGGIVNVPNPNNTKLVPRSCSFCCSGL